MANMQKLTMMMRSPVKAMLYERKSTLHCKDISDNLRDPFLQLWRLSIRSPDKMEPPTDQTINYGSFT